MEKIKEKKWTIDKSFSFCYGHRVHNQRLNTEFTESGDACLACRHLHGHEGLIKVHLTGPASNVEETGMITDFKHLGWFKNFLDDHLDHKFIMDIKDPLFKNEFSVCAGDSDGDYASLRNYVTLPEGHMIPDLTNIRNYIQLQTHWSEAEQNACFEKYEGAVFVDFVPTSENLAGWLLDVVQAKMGHFDGVIVHSVDFNETPKSHCNVSYI